MNTGSTAGLREAAQGLAEDFIVFNTRPFPCDWGYLALDRIASVAESTGADLLYSDYYELVEAPDGGTVRRNHPVIDCTRGALRDDFDFGPVLVFRSASFLKALEGMNVERRFGALYDLRLRMDRIVHIGEYLCRSVLWQQPEQQHGCLLILYGLEKLRDICIMHVPDSFLYFSELVVVKVLKNGLCFFCYHIIRLLLRYY